MQRDNDVVWPPRVRFVSGDATSHRYAVLCERGFLLIRAGARVLLGQRDLLMQHVAVGGVPTASVMRGGRYEATSTPALDPVRPARSARRWKVAVT
jgi:hypothetical protein